MVTTRSKTGSLPAPTKVIPPVEDEVVKKPAKRVQIARVNTIRQDSKLLQLPVEILQEILSQADLIDLLSWSYCCRDLNDWLTSKRSQPLWTAARSNTHLYRYTYSYNGRGRRSVSGKFPVAIPVCPQNMTPFCHSSILFDNECLTCNSVGGYVYFVFTDAGLRKICENCKNTTLVTRKYLQEIWFGEDLPDRFWTALPAAVPSYWGRTATPKSNKFAYNLESSEAFLAKFQAYEAQVGFDESVTSDYLESLIESTKEKNSDMLAYLRSIGSWFWEYKRAMQMQKDVEEQHRQQLQVDLEERNRTNIIERSLVEDTGLIESDVSSALAKLGLVGKFDAPIDDADWTRIRFNVLKESNTKATARTKFTSIFNPGGIAFRKLLLPYWTKCLASFTETAGDPDYVIMPTLYEFSSLPALASLQGKHSSASSDGDKSVLVDVDALKSELTKLDETIQADLLAYSQTMLMQLASKLGGKRVNASDVVHRLSHPAAVFYCGACHRSYHGAQSLQAVHKCTERTTILHLERAILGDYYLTQEFKQEYIDEMGMRPWDVDDYLEKIPIRSVEKLRLDRDSVSDVNRILSLCDSCNVEVHRPVTMKTLEEATTKLVLVCEVCERYDDDDDGEELGGRYRGAGALLEHLRDTRERPHRWSHMRDEDNKPLVHGRTRIEGKTCNKRNARKAVNYAEAADE